MRTLALFTLALCAAVPARADEGMWTYDNFPKAALKKQHGFEPGEAWLEHARRASVRLAGGCSGSFVSASGLVMTNHHCVRGCIGQISTKERDYSAGGFYAQLPEQEVRCPEIELNELLQTTDVTRRVQEAVKGLKPGSPDYGKKSKEAKTALEKECAGGDEKARCDVVDLYHGGVYSLYKYRRYQDVRLVFAPEQDAAHFGGDPDNFSFPRWALDAAFVRAYDGDKPVQPQHWFKWSAAGAQEGELVFVSGHPGSTQRLLTVAEYQENRDVTLPERLIATAQWRGVLQQFAAGSEERARMARVDLLGVDNSAKAVRGRYDALRDPRFMALKQDEEKRLRARIQKKPALAKAVGDSFERIAKALAELRPHRQEYAYIEGESAWMRARTVSYARTLVRATAELARPEAERLREYRDTALPALKQSLFSRAPVHAELERLKIAYGLTKLREELGPDHPFVRKVLGKRSPAEIAEEVVSKSELKDPTVRRKLFEGGKAAVEASSDPAIVLARLFDADGRTLRKWYEDSVESAKTAASAAIARARFELDGTATYPDATFTLRLSYGTVAGWKEGGREVKPFTDFAGAYERHTGREPFKLADSWLAAKERVKATTPLDLATTNDIIGGNSGSPLFNKDQEIVGLIFDGNLPSLAGDYFFDPAVNRAVGVHSAGLLEALSSIYGAKRVVDELSPPAARGAPGAGAK